MTITKKVKACPNPITSIRDDHKERMTFNWNGQPIYTLPLPFIINVELENPPDGMERI